MVAITGKPSVSIASYFILSLISFSIFLLSSKGMAETISLSGEEEHIVLKGKNLEFYEDPSGKKSIHYIITNPEQSVKFSHINDPNNFFLRNSISAYWFKIKLKNDSPDNQHYIIESYNYRIDSVIFYELKEAKILSADSIGVAYKFEKREIKHKNITHSFRMNPGEEYTIYIKMKNRYETPVELVLREFEHFTSYSLSEYFFLGLFYGSIIIIIVLNILAGAYLKSKVHYYYVFYVFFVGIFFLSQDGMGFHFIWPSAQFLNDYAYLLSVYFMTAFLLLYTDAFLNLRTYYPLFSKIFYIYLIIRTFILFINFFFFPEIRHILYIDLLPFIMAYYCSYVSYRNQYPLSIYFLIGTTILIIGFLLNFLQIFSLMERNLFTFYVINLCFLLEMIVFYFALAERIRFYKQHKKISKDLKKVIEDNEQLIEQFTYKTSHDISGPVKTILGVTNIALLSHKIYDQHAYMQMIQTTALRLDDLLKSVAEINIIRIHEIEKIPLDTSILMESILNDPKIKQYSDKIKLSITNHPDAIFRTDNLVIYKLISTLLIYQLTSLDYKKEKELTLQIVIDKNSCSIISSNNAELIPPELHKEVFDLFSRLSNNYEDLGTYMHIVKLCVEKLNGEISINNSGSSTGFKISIPL